MDYLVENDNAQLGAFDADYADDSLVGDDQVQVQALDEEENDYGGAIELEAGGEDLGMA